MIWNISVCFRFPRETGADQNASEYDWIELERFNKSDQKNRVFVYENVSMALPSTQIRSKVVIGPVLSMPKGNRFEWEGGQNFLEKQMKHELSDWSGSQINSFQKSHAKI